MKPATTAAGVQRAYRNNSPDALFGSLLAIEAVLGVVVAELARSAGHTEATVALEDLRTRVQMTLGDRDRTTKYGTGASEIKDGERDSLDQIFAQASKAPAATD